MNPFAKRRQELEYLKMLKPRNTIKTDESLYFKCKKCNNLIARDEFQRVGHICPECNAYCGLTAFERIGEIIDNGTFFEMNGDLNTVNHLDFPDYDDKIKNLQQKTQLNEAVITGIGNINGLKVCIGVMDSAFLMGSMGTVVGEKITLLFEYATFKKLPVIMFCASGGARMQEGILSLMQMAKTSAAVKKHSNQGLLYISVLTNPTTGGVTASFASLGDIILAEPNALIGFAGPRVIEQTIKQTLPEGFQRSEYLLENGFIDKIVERQNLKITLAKILKLHSVKGGNS